MKKIPNPKNNVKSEVIDGVKHIYLTKTIFVENGEGELEEVDDDYTLHEDKEYEICFTPTIKAYAEYMLVNGEILKNPDYDDSVFYKL